MNIIPILAKGDAYTPDEVKMIKKNIIGDAKEAGLEWFDCAKSLRNSPKQLNRIKDGPFGPSPPFLIISSIKKIEISPNLFIFGRKYNWGICNIENPEHSDFLILYQLLIGHFSLDLVNKTKLVYRQYLKLK